MQEFKTSCAFRGFSGGDVKNLPISQLNAKPFTSLYSTPKIRTHSESSLSLTLSLSLSPCSHLPSLLSFTLSSYIPNYKWRSQRIKCRCYLRITFSSPLKCWYVLFCVFSSSCSYLFSFPPLSRIIHIIEVNSL